jgi:hypothetical protein
MSVAAPPLHSQCTSAGAVTPHSTHSQLSQMQTQSGLSVGVVKQRRVAVSTAQRHKQQQLNALLNQKLQALQRRQERSARKQQQKQHKRQQHQQQRQQHQQQHAQQQQQQKQLKQQQLLQADAQRLQRASLIGLAEAENAQHRLSLIRLAEAENARNRQLQHQHQQTQLQLQAQAAMARLQHPTAAATTGGSSASGLSALATAAALMSSHNRAGAAGPKHPPTPQPPPQQPALPLHRPLSGAGATAAPVARQFVSPAHVFSPTGRFKQRLFVAALGCSFLFSCVVLYAVIPGGGERVALLIGLNEYAVPGLPALKGCVNGLCAPLYSLGHLCPVCCV